MRLFLISAVMLLASSARAHSFWMELARREDGARTLELFVGEHLKTPELVENTSSDQYQRFGAALGGARTIDLALFLSPTGAPAAVIPAAVRARVLFLDSTQREVSIPPETFRVYLEQEGLGARVPVPPDRIVHEEYFRCAKALLPPAGDARVDLFVGQELELVPAADPFAAPARQPVRFKVLRNGAPLSGVTAFSANRIGGRVTVVSAPVGADGTVTFPRPVRGEWLVSVVLLEPSKEEGFDFRSVWSSVWIPLDGLAAAASKR